MHPHHRQHRSRTHRSTHSHGYYTSPPSAPSYHQHEDNNIGQYDEYGGNPATYYYYQQDEQIGRYTDGGSYQGGGEWGRNQRYYYNHDDNGFYYPDRTYDYGYERDSLRRRDRYRDQRRNYHHSSSSSSSSRRLSETSSDTRGEESAGGSSFAGRLFQHLEDGRGSSLPYRNMARAYAVSSMRNSNGNSSSGTRCSRSPPPRRPNLPKSEPMRTNKKRQLGPDEAYLSTSLEASRRLEDDIDGGVEQRGLVRKLLVLDLNGTLVYRSPHRWNRDRNPAGERDDDDVYAQFDSSQGPRPLRAVHPRPYLVPFCTFLLHPDTKKWLDTMVWSSAQPHSVNDMVGKCFGERKGELVTIWARDRLGLSEGDYGRKVQTTKDLNKPWEELGRLAGSGSSAAQKRNHSARTTLLLDDSPLKAHLQPYNHLCIKDYDLGMRRKDIDVRELEVARKKLAGVLEGKEEIEDVLRRRRGAATKEGDEETDPIPIDNDGQVGRGGQGGEATNEHKRKRKEKKEYKKKERMEQQLKKLTEECENPGEVYDETLLAVVGILDAAKRESNIAAWIRSGGLIESLSAGEEGAQAVRGERSFSPEGSVSTTASSSGSPRKKTKTNEGPSQNGGKRAIQEEVPGTPVSASLPIEHTTPVPSSPPLGESSPVPLSAEAETEKTGVPLTDSQGATGLWFDHPGTLTLWASRGRKVLDEMGIEAVAGIVGPTG